MTLYMCVSFSLIWYCIYMSVLAQQICRFLIQKKTCNICSSEFLVLNMMIFSSIFLQMTYFFFFIADQNSIVHVYEPHCFISSCQQTSKLFLCFGCCEQRCSEHICTGISVYADFDPFGYMSKHGQLACVLALILLSLRSSSFGVVKPLKSYAL